MANEKQNKNYRLKKKKEKQKSYKILGLVISGDEQDTYESISISD